jgi:hypothetical protein
MNNNAPQPASNFMLVSDCVVTHKCFYDEQVDPGNPELLGFPDRWGEDNNVISQWITDNKLTLETRVNLEMERPRLEPEPPQGQNEEAEEPQPPKGQNEEADKQEVKVEDEERARYMLHVIT